LRRASDKLERQSGSHEIWTHEDVPGVKVSLAGRDRADAQPYQEAQVRQALERLRTVEETHQ
jgi:hypothetical protein